LKELDVEKQFGMIIGKMEKISILQLNLVYSAKLNGIIPL